MRILTVKELNETATLNQHDGFLLVVDVQSAFDKWMPEDYIKKVSAYCKNFQNVYQIWDSNKPKRPTYTFPNQKGLIEKKYGVKKYYSKYKGGFNEWVTLICEQNIANQIINSQKQGNLNEGDRFPLKGGKEFLVYIGNNHKWFFVNEDMYNLFVLLRGKTVITIGGADEECLKDIYVSAKSFNVQTIYNHEYIYSANINSDKKPRNFS